MFKEITIRKNKLACVRNTAGLTQVQLANKIGISYDKLKKIEQSPENLNFDVLAKCSAVFNLAPSAFYYVSNASNDLFIHNRNKYYNNIIDSIVHNFTYSKIVNEHTINRMTAILNSMHANN